MLFNQHTPDPPRPHPQNSQPNRPQNLKLHPKQSASTGLAPRRGGKGWKGPGPPPTHPPTQRGESMAPSGSPLALPVLRAASTHDTAGRI
jgi:hypothetical protein